MFLDSLYRKKGVSFQLRNKYNQSLSKTTEYAKHHLVAHQNKGKAKNQHWNSYWIAKNEIWVKLGREGGKSAEGEESWWSCWKSSIMEKVLQWFLWLIRELRAKTTWRFCPTCGSSQENIRWLFTSDSQW
jgi:hypothetical protein